MARKMGIQVFICVFVLFFNVYGEQSAEQAFTHIYKHKVWGTNQYGEAHSGGGSTVEATQIYRPFLEHFLRVYKIRSVVDLGCGDWEFSQFIDWKGIDYLGIDVVQSVIEKNQARYTQPQVQFKCGDGLQSLPAADLLICKDVLQHLTNADVQHIIAQFPKFKYCLITNDVNSHTKTSENHNIKRGQTRPLDLTADPFNVLGMKLLSYQESSNLKQVLLISNARH